MARTKAKKTTARKTTKRKTTTKKAPAKRATARKATAKKTTARKTTARKTAKKTTARKTTTKKTTVKAVTTAIKDGFNKSQILNHIAETTELSRKEINHVFETLGNLMHRHLKKGGAGEFTIPSLMKCVVKRKPATKARKGVNPFTGEEMMFKAKPARNIVKIRPLKKLKEMVE